MKTEDEIWAGVLSDSRWYDGTPQSFRKIVDHFKEKYKVEERIKP